MDTCKARHPNVINFRTRQRVRCDKTLFHKGNHVAYLFTKILEWGWINGAENNRLPDEQTS